LVEAAEAWARSCGYAEIASDCHLENDVSLKAHTALGFQVVERLIHFRKSLADRAQSVASRKPIESASRLN
jgi:aminoglycoside 6'-N-acetyltransferase I